MLANVLLPKKIKEKVNKAVELWHKCQLSWWSPST